MTRAVIGIASRAGGQRLTVTIAAVSVDDKGCVDIDVRESWRGNKNQASSHELTDLHDAIGNLLSGGAGQPLEGIAVKRVEQPQRGRPPGTYDDRIRLEAVAMLAAVATNTPFFSYRRKEMARGSELSAKARECNNWPDDDESQEAVDAACAALSDLLPAAE